jgi:hypothetical protein
MTHASRRERMKAAARNLRYQLDDGSGIIYLTREEAHLAVKAFEWAIAK